MQLLVSTLLLFCIQIVSGGTGKPYKHNEEHLGVFSSGGSSARQNVAATEVSPRQTVELGNECRDEADSVHYLIRRKREWFGYDARLNEFPSFAYLRSRDGICGGTLLTYQHILTSEKCILDEPVRVFADVYVPGGRHPIFKTMRTINSTKICSLNSNSLAIIKLQKPIPKSRRVRPACLPERPLWDNTAFSVGLGLNNHKMKMIPNVLQVLKVKSTNCPRIKEEIQHRQCFTNHNSTDTGNISRGDAGGPVIARMDGKTYVYGVLSYILDCSKRPCSDELQRLHIAIDTFKAREDILKLLDLCA